MAKKTAKQWQIQFRPGEPYFVRNRYQYAEVTVTTPAGHKARLGRLNGDIYAVDDAPLTASERAELDRLLLEINSEKGKGVVFDEYFPEDWTCDPVGSSRAEGYTIRPHKGGKTVKIENTRVTPETASLLDDVLRYLLPHFGGRAGKGRATLSDWIELNAKINRVAFRGADAFGLWDAMGVQPGVWLLAHLLYDWIQLAQFPENVLAKLGKKQKLLDWLMRTLESEWESIAKMIDASDGLGLTPDDWGRWLDEVLEKTNG